MPTPAKETLRYKHMVARLKDLPVYKKEAALVQELAKGKQWRIDAAIEAIDNEKYGWRQGAIKSVNATNVLKTAAMFGRLQAMQTLCEKFKVTVPEEERGWTLHAPATAAYHTAMLHGHYRVAEYLVKACNTSADQRPEGYFPSAMNFGMDEGDMKKVNLMLKHGADGNAALLHAISTREPDMKMIRHLVEVKSADINKGAEGFWTPFLQAVKYGHNDIAEYLVSKGATPQNDKSAGEALYTAVGSDNGGLVKLMLGLGMKGDRQDIAHGLLNGSLNAVKILLDTGNIDVTAENSSMLLSALRSSKKPAEGFDLCLSYGAKPADALQLAKSWKDKDAAALKIIDFLEEHIGKAAPAAQPQQPKPPVP
jgi:ankyrin repeat protein